MVMETSSATATSASKLNAGRLNYGLHERVVDTCVSDEVRAKRREYSQPDILGLQGPQWNASVAVKPGKHNQKNSDLSLSNTISPGHISPTDFRHTIGTTHSPTVRQHSPQLERSLPQPFSCSSSSSNATDRWNASTAFDRREFNQGAVQVTKQSLQATVKKTQQLLDHSSSGYISPQGRADLVAEQARELKLNSKEAEYQRLEAKYGKEGAEAMLAMQRLPSYGSPRKLKGRATKDDLAAVAALPDYDGQDYQEGEQQQGQQDLQFSETEPQKPATDNSDMADVTAAVDNQELMPEAIADADLSTEEQLNVD